VAPAKISQFIRFGSKREQGAGCYESMDWIAVSSRNFARVASPSFCA
jgi:hypothetical protein